MALTEKESICYQQQRCTVVSYGLKKVMEGVQEVAISNTQSCTFPTAKLTVGLSRTFTLNSRFACVEKQSKIYSYSTYVCIKKLHYKRHSDIHYNTVILRKYVILYFYHNHYLP